jgi:SCY1-like protein 1
MNQISITNYSKSSAFYRIVRDQANKTLDLYLQRIRKYSQTLPETALPPQTTIGPTSANAPRMGTPQQDTSWAGWAISSFTNKLASASGEMQSNTNGSEVAQQQQRPSSVPPTTSYNNEKPITTSPFQHGNLAKPSRNPANTFAPTSLETANNEIETEDFGAAWGGEEVGADTSTSFDPFAPSALSDTPATTYDDKGEPDFAGWLTAQAQAKQKAKNSLPKGLAKSSQTTLNRPSVGARSNTTGQVANKKAAVLPARTKPAASVRKAQPKEEDEGWGDAWD